MHHQINNAFLIETWRKKNWYAQQTTAIGKLICIKVHRHNRLTNTINFLMSVEKRRTKELGSSESLQLFLTCLCEPNYSVVRLVWYKQTCLYTRVTYWNTQGTMFIVLFESVSPAKLKHWWCKDQAVVHPNVQRMTTLTTRSKAITASVITEGWATVNCSIIFGIHAFYHIVALTWNRSNTCHLVCAIDRLSILSIIAIKADTLHQIIFYFDQSKLVCESLYLLNSELKRRVVARQNKQRHFWATF